MKELEIGNLDIEVAPCAFEGSVIDLFWLTIYELW